MKLDRKNTHTELIFSLDEVAVFVPPYSKREIQSVQAKRELRSRLRSVFSKQERSRRTRLKLTPFSGNPHCISEWITKTDDLPAGSLTQKVLAPVNAANFRDHQPPVEVLKKAKGALQKNRQQKNLKSWSTTLDSLLRSKAGVIIPLLALIIVTSYSKDPLRNAYVLAKRTWADVAWSGTGKATSAAQATPVARTTETATNPENLTERDTINFVPEKLSDQPVVSQAIHQPKVKLVKTDERPTARVEEQRVTERTPLPLPGIPIGPIPEISRTHRQSETPSTPATIKSPDRPDQKSSSVVLSGDLDQVKDHNTASGISIAKVAEPAPAHQPTPAKKELRWGSSSGLIAFSAKGVIALNHGQQIEVLPGEQLPNGKTLKAINQDSSVIVTNEGPILMK